MLQVLFETESKHSNEKYDSHSWTVDLFVYIDSTFLNGKMDNQLEYELRI